MQRSLLLCCCSQSATWDELLPAWNNPEGKARSWEAEQERTRECTAEHWGIQARSLFFLFITNSLFSRGDGNPPRQSNYITEGWENLWAPLLISTVSWTGNRPATTRSGESEARHKRLTDVIVLYKYKHRLSRRRHAANAHDSIAAESSSQVASGWPKLMKKVWITLKRATSKSLKLLTLTLEDLVVDCKGAGKMREINVLDSISRGENSFSDWLCSDFLYQPDSCNPPYLCWTYIWCC